MHGPDAVLPELREVSLVEQAHGRLQDAGTSPSLVADHGRGGDEFSFHLARHERARLVIVSVEKRGPEIVRDRSHLVLVALRLAASATNQQHHEECRRRLNTPRTRQSPPYFV